MTPEELYNLSEELKKERTVSSEETGLLLAMNNYAQGVAALFPVNETEYQRMYRISEIMWYCGRIYQKQLDNNQKEEKNGKDSNN